MSEDPTPSGSDCASHMGPDCFHGSMAHLYRGEMQRMVVWRRRLDTTTHWAIILSTGLTTFALGTSDIPHYIMLLGLAFNTIFMLVEGRRYQHLHHSKWRLQLIEHNYFAGQIAEAEPTEPTWRAQLAADLQKPHFTISHSMGIRLRLRRNYLILAYFITAVWLTKLFIHPESPADWSEFYNRLAVASLLPSWFVLATAATFIVIVTVFTVTTPSEEALEHWSKAEHTRVWESRVADQPSK